MVSRSRRAGVSQSGSGGRRTTRHARRQRPRHQAASSCRGVDADASARGSPRPRGHRPMPPLSWRPPSLEHRERRAARRHSPHTGWNQRLCDTDRGPLPCERHCCSVSASAEGRRTCEGSRLGQGRAGKSTWTGIWTWTPSAGPRAKVGGTRGPGPGASGHRPTEQCWVVAPHGLLSCCPLLCSLHMIVGIQPAK